MRYIIRFSKTGNIRYISHLDIMRLFQRTFKRADIRLLHSQGFNPHPRMVLAQPLSLGFESTGEYLEFYCPEGLGTEEELRERLNALLPAGVEVLACKGYEEAEKKSLAALVSAAAYETVVYDGGDGPDSGAGQVSAVNWAEILERFIELKEIPGEKRQKKTKSMETVDIRPLLKSLSLTEAAGESVAEGVGFSMVLAAGGNGNLNPEVLLKSLFDFAGVPYEDKIVRISRRELYKSGEKGELLELI